MPTAPQHAIIIGAGMGGLLAARVLADVCAKVTRLLNVTPCRMPLGGPRGPGRGRLVQQEEKR
jgi:ribulose 1,5-bisphosphate synthetase/thiazole synthase